ncbi:glycosyltransferase family 4 protein [Enteractinococcus coprophilus]|uniref:Glycosyltransferase involved in cell wall biosynthesis n=1 Tax=Enteractinococcus coprophilus TaxID=1027633 RepID=A0A543AMS0_9MICC|nr:glycosyltransferase family 4 protein [Enteractinococcus coprophilus]TQL73845.1 glycosyltransferase involved in cell wall biosynthesis [Enteractinococcus coprophilus]
MKEIVFWQEALSIHRAPVIRELSRLAGLRVSAVSFNAVSSARQAMGWDTPDYGQAHLEIFDPSHWQRAAEAYRNADVHVFAGFGAWPGLREVQAHLAPISDAMMFVLTEPWDDRGFKGFLRLLRAGRRVKRLGPHLSGVLPCGPRAKQQLQSFRPLRSTPIYDFGYFVDASAPVTQSPADSQRLIFVGALAEWKRPLLLIRVLARLQHLSWHLDMYGQGAQSSEVHREIELHSLEGRIHVHDYRPYHAIREEIAASDLLILPSAHDGWGAVINEALMDGTRVVVSDAAGASDLVTHEMLGGRFRSGDRSSLEDALRSALAFHHDHQTCSAIRTWADKTISPTAAAEYLKTILLTLPKPVTAPWKEIAPSLGD